MSKKKFKVGNRYRAKKNTAFSVYHGENAKGDIVQITKVTSYGVDLTNKSNNKTIYFEKGSRWDLCFDDYFEKIKNDIPDKEISITFHGRTTVAKLKVNNEIKAVGVARCNPDDKFDENKGIELAVKRIYDKNAQLDEVNKDDNFIRIPCGISNYIMTSMLKLHEDISVLHRNISEALHESP